MAADDLPVPADKGDRLDDHEAVEQVSLPNPHTDDQHRQPLSSAEPRMLPQLTLQDEHLLTEGEDLPVAFVTEQSCD